MAMKKRGIRCLPPVDLFKGPYKWDLADEAILRRVLRLIVKAAFCMRTLAHHELASLRH